jgi:hypothetical protein
MNNNEVDQIKCYCGHTDYCDCGPDVVENANEIGKLVESWRQRQLKYEDLAQKHADNEHNFKKFTYKAMATRDCWKELLELVNKSKN